MQNTPRGVMEHKKKSGIIAHNLKPIWKTNPDTYGVNNKFPLR